MGDPPFRAEVIGSLLRPRIIKDTATAIANGKAAAADYQSVLEHEIARAVARQEELGLRVATDGEFGRTSWFGFFFEESPDDLRRRIDEAARFVDLDRLSLSSRCGFASVAGGNSIDENTQWAKLGLIVDTARAVWGTA